MPLLEVVSRGSVLLSCTCVCDTLSLIPVVGYLLNSSRAEHTDTVKQSETHYIGIIFNQQPCFCEERQRTWCSNLIQIILTLLKTPCNLDELLKTFTFFLWACDLSAYSSCRITSAWQSMLISLIKMCTCSSWEFFIKSTTEEW